MQFFIGLLFLVALHAGATAAPPDAAAQAAQVYASGVAAFKAANYASALTQFERAYKLDPAPVLLYNIARCHEEMGNAKQATEGFGLYLARQPKSTDRADVERRIRVMEAILARQSAAAADPVRTAPPVLISIAEPDVSWQMPWGLGLTAAGALGLGMGIVFGISAQDNEQAHQTAQGDAQKSRRLDKAESDANAATISFVAGGVFFAAGAGLLLWDLLGESATQMQVIPMPGGAAVGWSTNF
ncbi:MAG: tetratricopeptide (TPR) repeat protein [Bradymonadia bacterium]|jgi:tetratricopeptide (TPR) repeat protein